MKLNNFPLVLWINLDRSWIRHRSMLKKLSDLKLRNIRIPAIDGTGRDTSVLTNICDLNHTITPAENACTVSHLLAIKYFYEQTNEEEVVIAEDDVSFIFLDLIPFDWSEFRSSLPRNWKLIQLAVTTDSVSLPSKEKSSGTIPVPALLLEKVTPESKHYCSAAYLINRSGAKQLLDRYYTGQRINLRDNVHVTADAMITSTTNTYSIPIISYETAESTIHAHHLTIHSKCKQQQYQMWIAFNKFISGEQ
jgi:GR25 family glycosyltransferase involved in LPS biosynthesis